MRKNSIAVDDSECCTRREGRAYRASTQARTAFSGMTSQSPSLTSGDDACMEAAYTPWMPLSPQRGLCLQQARHPPLCSPVSWWKKIRQLPRSFSFRLQTATQDTKLNRNTRVKTLSSLGSDLHIEPQSYHISCVLGQSSKSPQIMLMKWTFKWSDYAPTNIVLKYPMCEFHKQPPGLCHFLEATKVMLPYLAVVYCMQFWGYTLLP